MSHRSQIGHASRGDTGAAKPNIYMIMVLG
jgi:hypothetical protein